LHAFFHKFEILRCDYDIQSMGALHDYTVQLDPKILSPRSVNEKTRWDGQNFA